MLFAIVASATDTVCIPAKREKKIVQLHEIVSQVWCNILLHQIFAVAIVHILCPLVSC